MVEKEPAKVARKAAAKRVAAKAAVPRKTASKSQSRKVAKPRSGRQLPEGAAANSKVYRLLLVPVLVPSSSNLSRNREEGTRTNFHAD